MRPLPVAALDGLAPQFAHLVSESLDATSELGEGLFGTALSLGELIDALGELVDALGELIEALGELVDALGELIDALGELIEALGKLIDLLGELVDALGELVEALGELIDLLGELIDLLGELIDALNELFEPLLGATLSVGQISHNLRQTQQLVAEHQAAQLRPPLGVFLEGAEELVKVQQRRPHTVEV